MLSEGTDYLFFPKVTHTGGAITGLKNSQVALVCTPRFLFLFPIQETSLGLASVKVTQQRGVADAIAAHLAASQAELAGLEGELRALTGGKADRVIEIATLTKFRIWALFSRFLHQVRYQAPSRATEVLALGGKAATERFRSFYAGALAGHGAAAA